MFASLTLEVVRQTAAAAVDAAVVDVEAATEAVYTERCLDDLQVGIVGIMTAAQMWRHVVPHLSATAEHVALTLPANTVASPCKPVQWQTNNRSLQNMIDNVT